MITSLPGSPAKKLKNEGYHTWNKVSTNISNYQA